MSENEPSKPSLLQTKLDAIAINKCQTDITQVLKPVKDILASNGGYSDPLLELFSKLREEMSKVLKPRYIEKETNDFIKKLESLQEQIKELNHRIE